MGPSVQTKVEISHPHRFLTIHSRLVHKLFVRAAIAAEVAGQSTRPRNLPEWVFSEEWSCAGAVVSLASPATSLLGDSDKPGCYIAVGLGDGTVQVIIPHPVTV